MAQKGRQPLHLRNLDKHESQSDHRKEDKEPQRPPVRNLSPGHEERPDDADQGQADDDGEQRHEGDDCRYIVRSMSLFKEISSEDVLESQQVEEKRCVIAGWRDVELTRLDRGCEVRLRNEG